MYGISASGAQGRDSTLSICHALLKNALLLSEIAKRPTFIFGNCTSSHPGIITTQYEIHYALHIAFKKHLSYNRGKKDTPATKEL